MNILDAKIESLKELILKLNEELNELECAKEKAEEDAKIKVGDIVSVIDCGEECTTYIGFFSNLDIEDEYKIRYAYMNSTLFKKYGSNPIPNKTFIIKAIKDDFALITESELNREVYEELLNTPTYIFGIDGLKKII